MADAPVSWMTLQKGTRVLASDGDELGTVADVIADREKDIFSGLSLSSGLFSGNRYVPADLVDEITSDSVTLTIAAADAETLEAQP